MSQQFQEVLSASGIALELDAKAFDWASVVERRRWEKVLCMFCHYCYHFVCVAPDLKLPSLSRVSIPEAESGM